MLLFIDFLLVIGFVIIVLIVLMLLSAKQKGLSQKLLIAFFVIAFLLNLDYYAVLHKLKTLEYCLFIFISGLEYILGPLILLYIKSLFYKNTNFRSFLKHLIPFIVFELFFAFPYIASILKKEYIFAYLQIIDNYLFRYYLSMTYLIVYAAFSLKKLTYYRLIAKSNYSSLNEYDLIWVRNLIVGTIIVSVIDILQQSFVIIYQFDDENFWTSGYLTAFGVVVLMTYLAYYGFKRASILVPSYLLEQEQLTPTRKNAHIFVRFDNNELESLKTCLYRALKEDKIYLDDTLTLSSLAAILTTTNKKISTLLNHHLNTNFYDYVNKFRFEDMIEKMKSKKYEKYTLLGIAFESGFKSKTSFNRIFKKETGLSPSNYKKQLQKHFD